MDIMEIQKRLPHRYPFLLVDRLLEVEPGKRAVAIKQVSINEPYFQGHFPEYPVMPGVLIVEALAQTSGLAMISPEAEGQLAFLAGLDKVRFREQVRPGDTLRLETEILRMRAGMAKVAGKAYVGETLVAEAEIMIALGQ